MPDRSPRDDLDRIIRMHHSSYAAVSRLLGRNAAYIQQFIKRGSPARLEDDDRRLIAAHFGVDEAMLGGGAAASSGSSDVLMVPQLDVDASAGPGATAEGEAALAHFGFDRRWLRAIGRGRPEDLSIIRVRGDSMAPTLADGDDILVDRADGGAPLRDGIYVLQRDETLLVKRVALSPASGRLSITSDNPAYPGWPDCPADAVRIVGRVVWAGRRLG